MKGAGALGALSILPSPIVLAANSPLQIGVVGKVKIPWFDDVAKEVVQAGKRAWRRRLDHQSDNRRSRGATPLHRGFDRQKGRRDRGDTRRRQGARASAEPKPPA
jgi:hypothetical protein